MKEYNYHINVIKKYFDSQIPMKRISIPLIRDFEKDMAGKNNLGAKTRSNILATVKRILNDAREEGYNVVVPPARKTSRGNNDDSEGVRWFEKDELERFLKEAGHYGNFYHDFFQFLAYTGLRMGEALPLTWDDIDLKNKKIHVNKALYEGKLGKPKTRSSKRTIDMYDPPVYGLLLKRKEEFMKHPAKELNLVFPGKDGYYRDRTHIGRIFKKVLERAGLDSGFTIHSFRHTCASLIAGIKKDALYIADHLGHRDATITLKVYTHLLEDDKAATTNDINKGFATLFNKPLIKAANN